MTTTDTPLYLDATGQSIGDRRLPSTNRGQADIRRRRSNSQSNVMQIPTTETTNSKEILPKRQQFQWVVSLTSLNETFVKKHITVPYHPDTRKLGRPAGARIKPDANNGYFDSRVLSRSHAAMFVDSASGKLMIKDLGSSNGTYVNEERIGCDPVEINVGDIIFLGFNIQVDTNHKQITARVENINVISNFVSSGQNNESKDQYLDFVQSLYNKVEMMQTSSRLLPNHLSHRPGEEIDEVTSLDSALFGDINSTAEDVLLGIRPKPKITSFNNSRISYSGDMDNIINSLATSIFEVKRQTSTIKTIEEFLVNYQNKLCQVNTDYLNREYHAKLISVEEEVSKEKKLTEIGTSEINRYKEVTSQKINAMSRQLTELDQENKALHDQIKSFNSTFDFKGYQDNNSKSNAGIDEKNVNETSALRSLGEESTPIKPPEVAPTTVLKKELGSGKGRYGHRASTPVVSPSISDTVAADAREVTVNTAVASSKDVRVNEMADSSVINEGVNTEKNPSMSDSPIGESCNDHGLQRKLSSLETTNGGSSKGHKLAIGVSVVVLGFILQKLTH